jgi:thiol-disulfide isomerase/thioredoxin
MLLLGSCGAPQKGKDEFSIQGKIKGMADKELSLERITPSKSEPLQKVTLDGEGAFSLIAKAEPNTLFQLRAQDGKRMLLYPESDALDITADAADIEAFEVQGSAKTQLLRDFNQQQYRLYMAYKVAEASLDGLDRLQDSLAWHRLEGTTDSAMIAYSAFMRSYCDTVKLPLLRAHAALSITPAGNYDYLEKLSERISQEMPGSTYASFIDAALAREADGRVAIVAPELDGTDLHGQPFSLTSLRGHRVLLLFWASYCTYSQLEIAQLRAMQQLFADKNARLVCFSIDDYPAAWQAYLQTAGIDWATHVRGLNGQQSEEIKRFRVQAIPSTYLINVDGMIETMDVRAGDLGAEL